MELFLDQTWKSNFLQILVSYVNLDKRVKSIRLSTIALQLVQEKKITFPGLPCLLSEKAEALSNFNQICAYLAEISFTKKLLYGDEEEVKKAVNEGFKNATSLKDETILQELNTLLSTRTFYATNHVTIADLALYARVYSRVLILQDAEKWELNHLFRWFFHIQHLPRVEAILKQQGYAFAVFPAEETLDQSGAKGKKKAKEEKQKGGDPALRQQALEQKNKVKQEGGEQPAAQTPAQQQQGKPQQQATQEKQEKKEKKPQQPTQQQQEQKKPEQPKAENNNNKQAAQPKAEKPKQPAPEKKEAAGSGETPATIEEFAQLDIRVGKIVQVWKHPESENLYCEKIDFGNGEIREIASGLQKFVPIENMSGLVIAAYNLKPRSVAGFQSNGMVMCASNADKSKVEILRPGANSQLGERVFVEGHQNLFSQEKLAQLNPKKKILEKSFLTMHTNENFQASYNGLVWKTSDGTINAQTIAKGTVS